VLVQAFLARAPVEAFHHGIFGRRAWPTEVEFHAMLVCPPVHGLRDALAAIVYFDGLRRAKVGNHSIKYWHQIFFLQALADLDGQAFPGVVVYDRQCAGAGHRTGQTCAPGVRAITADAEMLRVMRLRMAVE